MLHFLHEFIIFLGQHKIWWLGALGVILAALFVFASFSGAHVIPWFNIAF